MNSMEREGTDLYAAWPSCCAEERLSKLPTPGLQEKTCSP